MLKKFTMYCYLLIIFSMKSTLAQNQLEALNNFTVLTEGNLVNNNFYTFKGLMGSQGNVTGTYPKVDSVLRSTNSTLINALNQMNDLKLYLNLENGTEISDFNSELIVGVYTVPTNFQSNEYQSIKLVGNSTDTIIINIDGDLILKESTNIILQGILPENVFWNITGELKIERRSWVYGTFFATGNIIVEDEVYGAISVFSESDITLGASDIFTSTNYLKINNEILSQIPCNLPCIESNLVANGDFSALPNCVSTTNANGFNTDLIYKIGVVPSDPCILNVSEVKHYKIDNALNYWNNQCISTIADHTDNGSNLFFVDAFKYLTDNLGQYIEDTTNNLIWGQTINNIEPGKEYLFYFWSTNINQTHNSPLHLRILFNNIELPNTRKTIPGKIVQWSQHCIIWTAPGNIGDPTFSVTINIKQVDDFRNSGSGQDIVIDDIVFGKRGAIPVQITSTVTSNYCTGNSTTLSVLNPVAGYNYQWQLNGVNINGAVRNKYIATVSGNYSVIGYSNQGCLLMSNILSVTITALTGEFTHYTVTGNSSQIWTAGSTNNPFASDNGTVWIKNSLTIPSGKNITIKGMRFEFGAEAVLIIQAGATLTIEKNGNTPAILTSYNCPYTMWEGVQIASTLYTRGALVIKESCILENARIGVSNYSNVDDIRVEYYGFITATGAIFRNNFIAVKLDSKNSKGANTPRLNSSSFTGCQFLTTANMKDLATYEDGKHKTFVELSYINGVRFIGNTFKNSYHPSHPSYINNVFDEAKVTRNKGITALNASFKMESNIPNIFTNLWVGVDYSNLVQTFSNQIFYKVEFGSVAYGIILRGGNGVKVSNCKFNVDPAYSTGSVKVPKSFIGINSRGSVGYTFDNNQFEDGYCGIVSKSAGSKNIPAYIYRNTFSNVGKRTKGKGQGIYALGQNQPVQVKCNTFISSNMSDNVQNHWVSDGVMNEQGKCKSNDNTSPANNIFMGYNPVNADIYAKQPESGFIYNTQNTAISSIMPYYKEASANMTSVYVKNCNGNYDPEDACPDLNQTIINELIDEINIAISNEDDSLLTQLLNEAVHYYENEDSTGESTITFLNETPHSVAKWMLVAKYIQSDEYMLANDILEVLTVNTEEEQAEKQLFQLLIQLENENASLLELNQSAIDQITSLAELDFAVSYEAQGILHYLYGNAFYIPLPYEDESELPIFNADTTSSSNPNINIYPNPTNNYITISNPNNIGIYKVELQNINSSTIFSEVVSNSNIVNLETITNGIYLVVIHANNGEKTIKKLVISK